jgi:hypothetical protein
MTSSALAAFVRARASARLLAGVAVIVIGVAGGLYLCVIRQPSPAAQSGCPPTLVTLVHGNKAQMLEIDPSTLTSDKTGPELDMTNFALNRFDTTPDGRKILVNSFSRDLRRDPQAPFRLAIFERSTRQWHVLYQGSPAPERPIDAVFVGDEIVASTELGLVRSPTDRWQPTPLPGHAPSNARLLAGGERHILLIKAGPQRYESLIRLDVATGEEVLVAGADDLPNDDAVMGESGDVISYTRATPGTTEQPTELVVWSRGTVRTRTVPGDVVAQYGLLNGAPTYVFERLRTPFFQRPDGSEVKLADRGGLFQQTQRTNVVPGPEGWDAIGLPEPPGRTILVSRAGDIREADGTAIHWDQTCR